MSKKILRLYVLAALFGFSGSNTFAQERNIAININQRPIAELFSEIEAKTDYRIFCTADVETMMVSLNVSGATPENIIREALKGTGYEVSVFGSKIFIAKGRRLLTSLPDNFLITATEQPEEGIAGFQLERTRDDKADSEFKVYEVGNPLLSNTGEKVELTGYVLDFKTGEPISWITVYVENPNVSALTDSYGYYSLKLVPGEYEVKLHGAGQLDTKRLVKLHSSGRLDIETAEQVISFEEITVQATSKSNVMQAIIGVERIKFGEMKNIPTPMGEKDLMKVVTLLPGVKSVGEVSSGFNVRGGATDQNLILFNDNTIYNPSHIFGLLSTFNPDLVNDMELYKSSIPAKYGGRISSVLDISGKDGNRREYIGSASIGLLTSRAAFEGPLVKDKGSFIVGARTTYSDWLLNLVPDDSGYSGGSAQFYDINASLNYSINDNNTIYGYGYFSQDNFSFDAPETYKYKNLNASLKWRHVFNTKLVGLFSGGYDHYDYDTRNTETPEQSYSLKYGIDQAFAKLDFTWLVHERHRINFGLNTQYYDLMPGSIGPHGRESLLLPDELQKENALESALYIGDTWDVTDNLTLDFGARYSMFNVLGPRSYNIYDPATLPYLTTVIDRVEDRQGVIKTYHGPEFRASLRYAITPDFSFKAGVNTMRQYIHKISNTSVMSPTDTWKLSDFNIEPQTGIQYAAGLYKNFMNNSIELSLEGYYKTMENYLDYRSGAQLTMNHNIETDVLGTSGRAYGIELMVRKKTGKLNGWVSYAYARTELRQDDPRTINPVNSGKWYPADFDKPHEFKFIGNYKITHRYSFSVNCEYSTGRPITLPVSKYQYGGGTYVYYTERNANRIPDYFRMDISFNIEPSHHLTLLTHSTFSIGVYNVTGRKNVYSVYYEKTDQGLKGYQLSIFGAPIPYASYNIRF